MSQGEMFRKVQAFDWSKTALGPMERWPQSLRIAVGICLSSRFPMFVWWGPERINIYNDAYIPMLGAKHPEALGRPAQLTWREIWDVVGPQADAVFERGEATWNERVLLVMQRHGYTEETYFTWSYSPIWDEQGKVGGIFCACTEETGRVAAERERDRLLAEVDLERRRLADAFRQSPSFLAMLSGPDHVFEYVNERYYALIGRRDLIGKPVHEALPEVEGQGFVEILDKVYRTGEPFIGTSVRIELGRGAGGELEDVFVDFVYMAMRDAGGTVSGVLAHGVDVTERQQTEARDRFLLSLEDALRPIDDPERIPSVGAELLAKYLDADRCAYADLAADGITFDLVGDYNRGVPSIVGEYRLQDFGEEFARLMHADQPFVVDDVDAHRPPIADTAAYRATRIRAVVCTPLRKAGRPVAMMAVHQASPRRWKAAEVELVQHVASRCYESIERARVERSLRESEAEFRQLADAMPQIVFSATPDGHIEYFNRQWYEYTGLPEGDTSFGTWKRAHTPEGLARVAAAWPEALRSGLPYEIEYPLRRRDGQYRWHLGRALPIRDERGRIVRWFGTNTDIHDRKQMEDALSAALANEQVARNQSELASRMKDEFLATLSHELRTPLNAILGWAHMMRRPGSRPEDMARGAEVIERNARAQAAIIEDLLDMSRIISGKVRLDLARVDLPAIIESAADTARPAADAKQIRLETSVAPLEGLEIRGDPNRMQQVLWNLLSNAIKFTPAGGRVRVEVARGEGRVDISVSDTGEGIAREFLPFVFDRFRQADASTTRRHGGLGLGLSIVKQLVELHGGTVRVASEGVDRGATFHVSLPVAKEMQAESAVGAPSAHARAVPIALSGEECRAIAGKRVLVVDDERDARELVRQLLEDCSAEVTVAASTAEALALVTARRFDLLVSDIGMPGEDGYALMRRVRRMEPESNGEIPAVALTAYARPEDRVNAIRAGFHMHLAKPIEPAELLATVASLARARA